MNVCNYILCNNVIKKNKKYCSRKCSGLARVGIPRSEETKRKVGVGNKGKLIGFKLSVEIKQKISNALKGVKRGPFSEIHKLHMALAKKGKKSHVWSDAMKAKISLANTGRHSLYKGIPRSEETRKKISKANKGKGLGVRGKFHHSEATKLLLAIKNKGRKASEEERKKCGEKNKGRIMSVETRRKIGLFNKGKQKTEEHKLKISLSNKATFARNCKGNFRSSAPEKEFGLQILNNFGIQLQPSKYLEGRIFDYCYEPRKILFECDGRYWHSLTKMIVVDQLKNEIAKRNGYDLVRYKLDDVNEVRNFVKLHCEEIREILMGNCACKEGYLSE